MTIVRYPAWHTGIRINYSGVWVVCVLLHAYYCCCLLSLLVVLLPVWLSVDKNIEYLGKEAGDKDGERDKEGK